MYWLNIFIPLIDTKLWNASGIPANKGFWADLLGFGDFYFELGVQITEICIATRSQNGGLIEMGELKRRIKAMRGIKGDTKATQQEISEYVKGLKTEYARKWKALTLSFWN